MTLPSGPRSLSRREAIAMIIAATAVTTALNSRGVAAELTPPGLGYDPNLLKKEIPWPRILTEAEKRVVTALCDVILPADEFGPAASAVGVPDFIDEWVSAPYEVQVKDSKVIREGIAWTDAEAKKRFGKGYAESSAEQQTALLEDMAKEGTEARKAAGAFFSLLRDRASGGYYTTQEGWKAIGYTGNAPTAEFAGPSEEVLRHAGLL